MFKRGDKIHLKDGTTHTMTADGLPPRAGKRQRKVSPTEVPVIRGFIRGALVNPDGTEQPGDWHENTVTLKGHELIVRNFAGMASSAGAQWWGIGSHNSTQASSNLQSQTRMDFEYGTNSAIAPNANGAVRLQVSASQALAGSWTLSQSAQYSATWITDNQVVNCLAQYASSAISTTAASADPRNCALSLATFASSSKSVSQALNVTYNWSFGPALLIAICLYAMMDKLAMLVY